jgi:2-iminobutanoate/2-iminopropanoate deaminase
VHNPLQKRIQKKEERVKTIIKADNAPPAVGPYSLAVRAGDFLFVSGQIGMEPETGKLADGGIEKQTEQALENISTILEAAGLHIGAVVKATVFLQHMGDFASMNGVYGSYFEKDPPARAAFEVARLPLGALVEIEVVAYAG